MNVWIVFIGETLPMDDDSREWRYGMLADALVAKGHTVLRWAPTFNHTLKKQRDKQYAAYKVNDHYSINLIHNKSYRKNISLKRLLSYRGFAAHLKNAFDSVSVAPDLIICGLPSPDACGVVTEYAKKNNIPVCIDIRDPWPDIFFRKLHPFLQALSQKLFSLVFYDTKKILRQADALIAVSQKYLDWGCMKSARGVGCHDKVFPIGYKAIGNSAEKNVRILQWLQDRGVERHKFICCYFGQLESTYDVETILNVAKHFNIKKYNKIQFVLCGKGRSEQAVIDLSRQQDNLVYLGWVSPETITSIMDISAVGLASYAVNAPQSLPNKPFEYMGGALPIVSSLQGELAEMIDVYNCGLTYEAGSAEQMASAILDLYNNPETVVVMSNNASELFAKEFSAGKIYPILVDYLEKIVSEKLSRISH